MSIVRIFENSGSIIGPAGGVTVAPGRRLHPDDGPPRREEERVRVPSGPVAVARQRRDRQRRDGRPGRDGDLRAR